MNKIVRVLINYFIKGLVVVLPLGITIYLIYWAVSSIDNAVNLSDSLWAKQMGQPVYVPGLGILTVVLVIFVAGILLTNVVTDPIQKWFNKWFSRLPLLKFIYSSIKDLAEAFVGEEKKFNEPVLVEVNEFGLKKIGFLTQKDMAAIGLPDEVAVYFPYSYSFAGQVIIVSANKIKPIDKNAADVMKFVVSGGVSGLE